VTAVGDKDIGGLDVSMNDTFGVRGVKRVGNVDAEREQRVQFHRASSGVVPQRLSLKILHRNKRLSILLADVVNGADVGVIEGRGGLGFALKAGKGLRIAGDIFRKKLESDETMEMGVLSLVNDAHATATKLVDDAVMRDGLANHCWETAFGKAC
jgi:hypothetical protein